MKKLLLILTLCFSILNAEQIKIEDASITEFNTYKFETPTGRQMKVPQKTELIIVAFEKDTGKLVNAYLDKHNDLYLPKKHAIYIADIHNMPSFVTQWFALPKLREYKHLIYLHYDEEFENFVPSQEEKITIIRIEDKKVVSVTFIETEEELEAVIQK